MVLLFLPRYFVEEPPLGRGEAGDALLADLVEHPVDFSRDGIGLGPAGGGASG